MNLGEAGRNTIKGHDLDYYLAALKETLGLTGILAEAGVSAIDALKIDVEGAEDIALGPFLRDAPQSLLPRLIVIEDTSGNWTLDLFAMLARRGYTELARSRHNIALALA